MSDYRIKVTIRNNRILKAIEAKGFSSVQKFCDQYKLYYIGVNSIINGGRQPLSGKRELKETVKELLDILDISAEDAFTKRQLEGFKSHTFTIEAKESQLLQLIDARKPLEINLMENDVNKLINGLLSSLPKRYEQALRMNMFENENFQTIGNKLNVTRERARQLVIRGIKKLKTHSNFNRLIESGAEDLFKNTLFKMKKEEIYKHFNPKHEKWKEIINKTEEENEDSKII